MLLAPIKVCASCEVVSLNRDGHCQGTGGRSPAPSRGHSTPQGYRLPVAWGRCSPGTAGKHPHSAPGSSPSPCALLWGWGWVGWGLMGQQGEARSVGMAIYKPAFSFGRLPSSSPPTLAGKRPHCLGARWAGAGHSPAQWGGLCTRMVGVRHWDAREEQLPSTPVQQPHGWAGRGLDTLIPHPANEWHSSCATAPWSSMEEEHPYPVLIALCCASHYQRREEKPA